MLASMIKPLSPAFHLSGAGDNDVVLIESNLFTLSLAVRSISLLVLGLSPTIMHAALESLSENELLSPFLFYITSSRVRRLYPHVQKDDYWLVLSFWPNKVLSNHNSAAGLTLIFKCM